MASRTAAGFSVHTGWAAAVLLRGPPAELLACLRLELADDEHDARFVYHAASERPDDAEKLIATAARVARHRAGQALAKLPAGALLALPPAKKALPELAAILRSHPLLHAAESELYRGAIVAAARDLGLAVVTPEKPVPPELGKPRPPWGKDQKLAAALAWAALSGPGPRARGG